MKTLYVYILECHDDTLYVGVTNNVGRRFIEHISGLHEDSYTFSRDHLSWFIANSFQDRLKQLNMKNN